MYEFRGDYETFYTGTQHGISNIGLLDKYNGEIKIPQWESPCGDVTGSSDGTKFPTNLKPEDKPLFFRKSMCRAKYLVSSASIFYEYFETYHQRYSSDSR